MGREDEIRLIAYNIWEQEGCISGCDCEHWYRAESIWERQWKSEPATKGAQRRPRKIAEAKPKSVAERKRAKNA